MGLFDKYKKKADKGKGEENATSQVIIDMLSRYIGPARQRQLAFGQLIVQNRNWYVELDRGVIRFGEDDCRRDICACEGHAGESVFASVEDSRVIRIILELIAQLPLNHKTLVRSMMKINCEGIDETENKLIGRYADRTEMSVSFDGWERIE